MKPAAAKPVPEPKRSKRIQIRKLLQAKKEQMAICTYVPPPDSVKDIKDPFVCSSEENKYMFLNNLGLFTRIQIENNLYVCHNEPQVPEQTKISDTKPIKKQLTPLKPKAPVKKSNKTAAKAQCDNSFQTMTDRSDSNKISDTEIVKPEPKSKAKPKAPKKVEKSTNEAIKKQPINRSYLKRNAKKRFDDMVPTTRCDNSFQTKTDPSDCNKISDKISIDENASQNIPPPVVLPKSQTNKRKATQINGKYSKVLKKSNENEEVAMVNCGESVLNTTDNTDPPSNVMKKKRQGAAPDLPKIVSSLNEAIQTCLSNVNAFKVPKEPLPNPKINVRL